jgi:uncharacterized protein YukE
MGNPNNPTFDFGEAKALEQTLIREIESIKQTLNKTETKVEACQAWWKGGSEQAFIENFKRTKTSVTNSLQQWLESYQRTMAEIARVKDGQERELAQKIRAM